MSNKCPKCLNAFTQKTKFCKVCGCNLEQELIETPTCPKCNTTYSSDVKFCINDGIKLVHPDKLIPECSVCKKKYTNGAKFCPLDGGAIKLDDDILKMKVNDTQKENKDSKIQENISTPQQPITNGPRKYDKAPNGKRFLAYLLDTMIIIGLCLPSLYLMTLYFYSFYYYYVDYGYIQEIPKKFILGLVLLIIPIGYALMKDGIGEGQSYGKRALDLMVINLNTYEQCTKLNSVGRNLLFGIICGIPCVGTLLEIIMVFANPEGRKLSDLIAGTQVIEKSTYINNLNY
jgi:uncharacterized RDD family membrane protein YckC